MYPILRYCLYANKLFSKGKAGLSAARARGRKGGRKPISADDPKVKTAKRMHKDYDISIDQICQMLSISRATF